MKKPFLFNKKSKTNRFDIASERKHIINDKSPFAVLEAYKSLRTNLNFALMDEDGCKVIAVTSALMSEGKSTTSVNLAITYAAMNYRVLLIECDLRRPTLARRLELKSKVGLSNLLIDSSLFDEVLTQTKVENLDFISSGSVPPNPTELLASAKMEKLLAALKSAYDVILLDCPPVNIVADACILAPLCSGVLFVVHSGVTDRGSVDFALEQLQYAKAKILGFVLSGEDMSNSSYGYRGYYKRGYYKRGYYKRGYGYYNQYGYGEPTGEKEKQSV